MMLWYYLKILAINSYVVGFGSEPGMIRECVAESRCLRTALGIKLHFLQQTINNDSHMYYMLHTLENTDHA